jgi:6,7-dimethyl-8-ribityllumazine synthase
MIVARYNWAITGALLQQAQEELLLLNVTRENMPVVYVPGTYELATAAQAMLRGHSYDALICFGCVMRGETRHDVVVSDAAAQGIQRVALDAHVPVIFGIMCVQNQLQAEARIPRGRECARAAIEMAQMMNILSKGNT